MSTSASRSRTEIPIFIDGEKYTVAEEQTTASGLLTLVGKTSDEWYLVLKQGRDQTEFRGDAAIELKPGAKFLTVFTGSTPVS